MQWFIKLFGIVDM
jgi:hypothetical protein